MDGAHWSTLKTLKQEKMGVEGVRPIPEGAQHKVRALGVGGRGVPVSPTSCWPPFVLSPLPQCSLSASVSS